MSSPTHRPCFLFPCNRKTQGIRPASVPARGAELNWLWPMLQGTDRHFLKERAQRERETCMVSLATRKKPSRHRCFSHLVVSDILHSALSSPYPPWLKKPFPINTQIPLGIHLHYPIFSNLLPPMLGFNAQRELSPRSRGAPMLRKVKLDSASTGCSLRRPGVRGGREAPERKKKMERNQ